MGTVNAKMFDAGLQHCWVLHMFQNLWGLLFHVCTGFKWLYVCIRWSVKRFATWFQISVDFGRISELSWNEI